MVVGLVQTANAAQMQARVGRTREECARTSSDDALAISEPVRVEIFREDFVRRSPVAGTFE